jgi:cyanate lyase
MSWLQAILAALQAINALVAWLRERQLITAGEAEAVAEGLKLTNDRIAAALAARRRARDSDPDPHDPYLRD